MFCRKGPILRYSSSVVLEHQNLLHYGRGFAYSNSDSGDQIRYRATISVVGNDEYCRNCERSDPI